MVVRCLYERKNCYSWVKFNLFKTFANSCYWVPRGSLRCFDDAGWSRRLEEGCLKLKLRDYESKWKLLRLRLKLISLDRYLWTNVTLSLGICFVPIIYQIEGNEKIYEKREKKFHFQVMTCRKIQVVLFWKIWVDLLWHVFGLNSCCFQILYFSIIWLICFSAFRTLGSFPRK